MEYSEFLKTKTHLAGEFGFHANYIPDMAFDFQRSLIDWSCKQGRAAVFADCGLGKTLIQLAWAKNIISTFGGRVLILTPIAVSHQTVNEGRKFGISCERSVDGTPSREAITITNYEKLHLFNAGDYHGVVCDESSILKNYDGKRRGQITEFMRLKPYRLLCTATAAPNDYIELGTSSEALGIMGHMDMLTRYFRNTQNNSVQRSGWGQKKSDWRFKKHAETAFWRWVCSWARAVRSPGDLGFDDGPFQIPKLIEREHIIENQEPLPGELFVRPAVGLREQRDELRATISQRCELVANLVDHRDPAVCWCHLNAEGDLLEQLIPDSVQVSGKDSDETKEEKLLGFSNGEIRVLITKPRIGGFGLNWQHCAHMTFFPSHSYEAYYQGVRRCWRFGQTRDVIVDIVTTKGGIGVLQNLQRKADQANRMFDNLVRFMHQSENEEAINQFTKKERIPAWL